MGQSENGYPHVTRILAAAGLIDTTWFTSYDSQRGTALHLATQLLDEGTLDWSTVDSLIVGRLRAYQRFKEEMHPEILLIEYEVKNETLGYQGRLDRVVKIAGREGVLDIKSGVPKAADPVQVAMYAKCLKRPMALWLLYLTDQGYRLEEQKPLDLLRAWEVAKAAITIAKFKEVNDV